MTNTRIPAVPGHTGAVQDRRVYPYYAAFTGTAAALGTTAILNNMVSDVRFNLVVAGAETVAVSASKDGTNYTTLIPIDESTGLVFASANLTNGSFKIPMNKAGAWKFFKFTKSAAVQVGTITFVAALARPNAVAFR